MNTALERFVTLLIVKGLTDSGSVEDVKRLALAMPSKLTVALALRELQGRTYANIGKLQGVSSMGALKRCRRARQLLIRKGGDA